MMLQIVPVARLEALKLSRLETFRALKSFGQVGGIKGPKALKSGEFLGPKMLLGPQNSPDWRVLGPNIFKCAKCGPRYEKAEDKIRKNKLLDSCINGGGDIFKEIQSFRKSNPVVATSMDGVKDDVKDHFKGIYEKLFNSADDAEELLKVQEEADRKMASGMLKWSLLK